MQTERGKMKTITKLPNKMSARMNEWKKGRRARKWREGGIEAEKL